MKFDVTICRDKFNVKPQCPVLIDTRDRHDGMGCKHAFDRVGSLARHFHIVYDFLLALNEVTRGNRKQTDAISHTKCGTVWQFESPSFGI